MCGSPTGWGRWADERSDAAADAGGEKAGDCGLAGLRIQTYVDAVMKRGFFAAVLVVSIAFVGTVFCMAARPSGSLQLWYPLLGGVLLVLSLMIPSCVLPQWKVAYAWRWLGLLLMPLLLVIGIWGGRKMRAVLFQRDLPALQRVVDLVAKGEVRVDDGRVVLTDTSSSPTKYVQSRWDEASSALELTFFVGGGFPVKHFAYLYRSDGKFPRDRLRHWPKRRQRAEHWFEVSD